MQHQKQPIKRKDSPPLSEKKLGLKGLVVPGTDVANILTTASMVEKERLQQTKREADKVTKVIPKSPNKNKPLQNYEPILYLMNEPDNGVQENKVMPVVEFLIFQF